MAINTEELLGRLKALESRVQRLESEHTLNQDWPIWPNTGQGNYTLGDLKGKFPELARVSDDELESCLLSYAADGGKR
jgi:hypothetical protein